MAHLYRSLAVCASLLLAGIPVSSHAVTVEGATLPPTMEVAGKALPLRGCGTREAFFINIYVAGLYLPQPNLTPQQILSPDVAKAVRLQIVYDGTLPEGIPDSWQEPLKDMARAEIERTIKDIYQSFKAGDQVTISYSPQGGTMVSINGRVTHSSAGDDVIQPLLRLWIGDRAVSSNLRQLLLKNTCDESGGGWL